MSARRRVVGVAVGLVPAALAFLLLPATLSANARAAAAIALLMAAWWIVEPVPLAVTALVPIVVFPALGILPLGDVLLEYVDPVNALFMGGMLIAAAMERWGLHERLALGIVARLGVGPRRIVLGFMVATAFVSLFISNTAAAVMIAPIGVAVLQAFGRGAARPAEETRRFGVALMLGIGYAASIGGVGSKVGTGTNFVFVKHFARTGGDVTFLGWLALGLPVVLVTIPLAWLYLVRVTARLPAAPFPGARDIIDGARARLGPRKRGETLALVAFLLAGVLWVSRPEIELGLVKFPGWAKLVPWSWSDLLGRPVTTLPRPFSELLGPRGAESMVAILVATALLILPAQTKPFVPVLPLRSAAGIAWGLLVLLGGGFALAAGISASGLSDVIAGALRGLSLGSPWATLVLVCVVTTAISEVASNTATASILLPVLAATAPGFGLPVGVTMFAATLAASFGFMLPAGTPPNAVVYASGYIRSHEMARAGLVIDLGGAVLIATLIHWLGPLVLPG